MVNPHCTPNIVSMSPLRSGIITQEMMVELNVLRMRLSAARREYLNKKKNIEALLIAGSQVEDGPVAISYRQTMLVCYE